MHKKCDVCAGYGEVQYLSETGGKVPGIIKVCPSCKGSGGGFING